MDQPIGTATMRPAQHDSRPSGADPRSPDVATWEDTVPERVGVYIDGFNLYYGVRAATGRRFLWLDVERLARELLRPHQSLQSVTYFTSRVRTPAARTKPTA